MGETNLTEIMPEVFARMEAQQKLKPVTETYIIDQYMPESYDEFMANSLQDPEWLVESLFPVGGVSIIGGDGGIGKSWIILHLALCVATGQALFGHFPVKQGKVLIIDEEDAKPLIKKRLDKLSKGMGMTNRKGIPLSILANESIMIDNKYSYERLSNSIIRRKPSLVTIDSLIRVHNKDENSANEMNDVLRRIKALIANLDSSIILTHHTNKASPGLRGSTDIRNFVDSCICIQGVDCGTEEKRVTHDKSRWDIKVPSFRIRLEDVDDGNATVLSYVGNTPVVGNAPAGVTLAANMKRTRGYEAREIILRVLKEKGTMSRKDILYQTSKAQIGQVTTDNMLKKLVQEGIISSQGGVGTEKDFRLKGK